MNHFKWCLYDAYIYTKVLIDLGHGNFGQAIVISTFVHLYISDTFLLTWWCLKAQWTLMITFGCMINIIWFFFLLSLSPFTVPSQFHFVACKLMKASNYNNALTESIKPILHMCHGLASISTFLSFLSSFLPRWEWTLLC